VRPPKHDGGIIPPVASAPVTSSARYLHLKKLLRFRLAQPFSPSEEILPAKPSLPAKRSYRLPPSCLLGDEPLPFPPCLSATLFSGHPTRLLSRAQVSKMGFGYRSLYFCSGILQEVCSSSRIPLTHSDFSRRAVPVRIKPKTSAAPRIVVIIEPEITLPPVMIAHLVGSTPRNHMVKPKPNAPNVTKPPPNKISRVGGIRRAFWLSMLRSPLTTLQNTDGVNHGFLVF